MNEDQEFLTKIEDAKEAVQPTIVQAQAKTHLQVWQKVEQWSQKLDADLKAEFAQFVEEYKNLI